MVGRSIPFLTSLLGDSPDTNTTGLYDRHTSGQSSQIGFLNKVQDKAIHGKRPEAARPKQNYAGMASADRSRIVSC